MAIVNEDRMTSGIVKQWNQRQFGKVLVFQFTKVPCIFKGTGIFYLIMKVSTFVLYTMECITMLFEPESTPHNAMFYNYSMKRKCHEVHMSAHC